MARISEQDRQEAAEVRILPAAYGEEFNSHFREETEDEKEFKKFFDEMQQSNDYAKIGVYRVPTDNQGRPRGKQLAFMFEVQVGELTYTQLCSRVRDEYGSGTFRFQIRDEHGSFVKSKTITIEAPKNADAAPTAASMVQQVSAAMQEQSRSIEEMLSRNRPPSGINLKEILSYVVPAATALAALGITFKRESPKSTLDTLKEFQLMKEIFMPSENDGDSNIFSLLEKTVVNFGPAFAQAIATGAERRPEVLRPQLPRPPNPVKSENDAMQTQVESMKPQLEILAQQAQLKTKPEAIANFFIDSINDSDEITDEQIDAIETFLNLPDCFQRCVAVVPALSEHSAWFARWQATMLDGLDESENSELTDESKPMHDPSTIVLGSDNAQAASDINGNPERNAGHAGDAANNVADSEGLEKEPTA